MNALLENKPCSLPRLRTMFLPNFHFCAQKKCSWAWETAFSRQFSHYLCPKKKFLWWVKVFGIGRSLAKQAGRSSWCQIRSKSKCALKGCICKNMILLEKNVPLYYEVSVAAMLLQLSFTPMHCRIAQQVTVAVFVQYCPKISRCFWILNP